MSKERDRDSDKLLEGSQSGIEECWEILDWIQQLSEKLDIAKPNNGIEELKWAGSSLWAEKRDSDLEKE